MIVQPEGARAPSSASLRDFKNGETYGAVQLTTAASFLPSSLHVGPGDGTVRTAKLKEGRPGGMAAGRKRMREDKEQGGSAVAAAVRDAPGPGESGRARAGGRGRRAGELVFHDSADKNEDGSAESSAVRGGGSVLSTRPPACLPACLPSCQNSPSLNARLAPSLP